MIIETLLLLLAAHWVCDYPLQGDFLARAKKEGPLPNYHLIAHSGIHAGAVYLVTGDIVLGFAEWFLHTWIDHNKNKDRISFRMDQTFHIICKLMYVIDLNVSFSFL